MTNRENKRESLKGGGFLRGSADGLSDMFLGWRALLLGCGGTLAGFIGAITNNGITTRWVLIAIGCVSLFLATVSWKYMKSQQKGRNSQRAIR